jgi:hypothetical protein
MSAMIIEVTLSWQDRQLPKFGNKKIGMCLSEMEGLAIPGRDLPTEMAIVIRQLGKRC